MVMFCPAYGGRPLSTDDADPVEPGRFELEIGVEYTKDSGVHHLDFPIALTMGVMPRVEIGVAFGGQLEHTGACSAESFSDLELAIKIKTLAVDQWWFDQAVALAVTLPTADRSLGSGETDFDMTWIATRQIGDRTMLLFNIGYTWVGENDECASDLLHYGPALTYRLNDMFEPVVELLFETPVDGGKTALGVNAGLRCQWCECATIDAAIGTAIAGDWPDLTTTVGMTLAF